MRVTQIHHVQFMIPVGRLEQARRFYCGVLGLSEIDKPDELKQNGGFWLGIGELQLHIGEGGETKRSDSREHIAFQVQDLNEWIDKLKSESIAVIQSPSIPGFMRIEFRDPFNNRIEFLAQIQQP